MYLKKRKAHFRLALSLNNMSAFQFCAKNAFSPGALTQALNGQLKSPKVNKAIDDYIAENPFPKNVLDRAA